MNVSAKDRATNKEQKITITSSSGLSKEDVERMVKEAAAHEAEDRKARETVEKKNRLDGLIHEIEKTLNENKEKIPQEDAQNTQAALEKAKTALKEHADNAEELQKATDELLQASHKVAELLYKQEQSKGEQSQDEPPKNDEGPIDVEAK